MKDIATTFSKALRAEFIKKKGTGTFWLSAVLAALAPIIFFIAQVMQYTGKVDKKLPYNYLLTSTEEIVEAFSSFFFPLAIIIVVTRIVQLDHRNGGWQLMETQPLHKFSIYFSKFTTILIANAIAIVTFLIVSMIGAYIFSLFFEIPETASLSIPFWGALQLGARLFIAALVITTLQYVIAVLMPSFIWAILIGFAAMLVFLFLNPFNLLPLWYPFTILAEIAKYPDGSDLGYWFTYINGMSIAASVILLFTGFMWYSHKTFRLAFFGKSKRSLGVATVLALGSLLIYWIMRPNQMPDYKTTVIAGHIDTDAKIRMAYLINETVGDTVASLPITDNKFHKQIDSPLVADYYTLAYGDRYKFRVYIGAKDSVYVSTRLKKRLTDIKISGTRLAENHYSPTPSIFSSVSYYINEKTHLDNPEFIINEIYDEWSDAYNEANEFRTVDNYIPKDDFLRLNKKLVSINYLSLWNKYSDARRAMMPNEKTIESTEIAEIRKTISMTDERLFNNEEYFKFIRSELVKDDNEDIDDDAKGLKAITKLQNGGFRDKMLYTQLKKSIEETPESEVRSNLIGRHSSLFSDPKYAQRINAVNLVVESLGKGKPAPLFIANDSSDKPYALGQFRGKYVVIDVWATWCGPCRYESPYFEKLAIKYKAQANLVFLALSVDQDITDWYIDVARKSKSIQQLHLNDPALFSADYNAETVPRFIMIDPNGNFVNARMPRPSEDAFEMILRKELGLKEL